MFLDAEFCLLLLEDSELDAELLKRYLVRTQVNHQLIRADSKESFLSSLNPNIDAVISDYNIPGFGAIPALEAIKSRGLDIPFVIVSGQIGEENAVEALRAGADDFIMKSNLSRLGPALVRSIQDHRRRRTEAQLRVAHERAVIERERLLAVVCHDLRNPLGSIQLAGQLLLARCKDRDVVKAPLVCESADRIVKASERISRLIRDILDQAKIESGRFVIEPSKEDLREVLLELKQEFSPQAQARSVTLKENLPDSPIFLSFDKERLLQVLSNLVGNAIKFSPEKGVVEISVEDKPDSVRVKVSDQGPGVEQKDLPHVFSKFYQSKGQQSKGTGLGLYIAQQIIEAHHGKIGVESGESGRGSVFWFELDKAQRAPIVNEKFGSRVLLVDDDEDLRLLVADALQERKMLVREAASVEEAISYLLNGEIFDVAIIDYDLPGRKGSELIEWIQSQSLPMKLVLTSAHPDVYERGAEVGITDVLRKPMKLERLWDILAIQ